MYTVFMDAVKQWNKNNDRHTKLQHLYLITSAVCIVLAGLISLLNYELGQKIVSLSAVVLGVFIFNAIGWALADSFIISHLTKRPTPKR